MTPRCRQCGWKDCMCGMVVLAKPAWDADGGRPTSPDVASASAMTTPKATDSKLSAERLAEIRLIWERGNTAVPVGQLLGHIAAVEAENARLREAMDEAAKMYDCGVHATRTLRKALIPVDAILRAALKEKP